MTRSRVTTHRSDQRISLPSRDAGLRCRGAGRAAADDSAAARSPDAETTMSRPAPRPLPSLSPWDRLNAYLRRACETLTELTRLVGTAWVFYRIARGG